MSGPEKPRLTPFWRAESAIRTRLLASASRNQKGVGAMSIHLADPVALALIGLVVRIALKHRKKK